jgi:hypothetical protein
MNYLTTSWQVLSDAIIQLAQAKHRSFEDILSEIESSFGHAGLAELGGFMSKEHAITQFVSPYIGPIYTEFYGDYAVPFTQTANAYFTPFLSALTTAVNSAAQYVTHAPDMLCLKEMLEWETYDYAAAVNDADRAIMIQVYSWLEYVNGSNGGWIYNTARYPHLSMDWYLYAPSTDYGHAAGTWYHAALHEINLLGAALTLDSRDALENADTSRGGNRLRLTLPYYADRIIESEIARSKLFKFSRVESS